MSASDVNIGTNGALIDFDTKAVQLTLSNQGWFLIYSTPFVPNLSFGFLSNSLISKFCNFADAYIFLHIN